MIDSTTTDGVRILAMDDGENRMNLAFVTALSDAIADAAVAGGPLVITGTGKFFSNGLDLDWIGSSSSEDVATMFERLYGAFADLLEYPGAVVAAVNGHAFGAGAFLAVVADHRVQRRDRGYFCFPEVDLGMAMPPPLDVILRMKFPAQTVLHALVSGHRFTGDESVEAGWADASASEDGLLAAATEMAGRYRDKAPAAVGGIKAVQHAPAIDVLRNVRGRGE